VDVSYPEWRRDRPVDATATAPPPIPLNEGDRGRGAGAKSGKVMGNRFQICPRKILGR